MTGNLTTKLIILKINSGALLTECKPTLRLHNNTKTTSICQHFRVNVHVWSNTSFSYSDLQPRDDSTGYQKKKNSAEGKSKTSHQRCLMSWCAEPLSQMSCNSVPGEAGPGATGGSERQGAPANEHAPPAAHRPIGGARRPWRRRSVCLCQTEPQHHVWAPLRAAGFRTAVYARTPSWSALRAG